MECLWLFDPGEDRAQPADSIRVVGGPGQRHAGARSVGHDVERLQVEMNAESLEIVTERWPWQQPFGLDDRAANPSLVQDQQLSPPRVV
jgi:hypothetical protein